MLSDKKSFILADVQLMANMCFVFQFNLALGLMSLRQKLDLSVITELLKPFMILCLFCSVFSYWE